MSSELKRFLEQLRTDEKFRQKIRSVKDREEKFKVIKEKGFDFSPEEVFLFRQELSDEDLEALCDSISWQNILWAMKQRLSLEKEQVFSGKTI